MKHLTEMNSFKETKKDKLITENTIRVGDNYEIIEVVKFPKSLVSAMVKKVKDESGTDLRETRGDIIIVEEMFKYLTTAYMNIENFPSSIFLGDGFKKGAQVQPNAQIQSQPQDVQAQVVQSTPNAPVQNQETQNAQATAQAIPAQEGGDGVQVQAQTKTQEV